MYDGFRSTPQSWREEEGSTIRPFHLTPEQPGEKIQRSANITILATLN